MTDLSDHTELVFSGYWRVLPKDADPVETREWLQAFDAVLETEGPERAHFLLRRLLDHARVSTKEMCALRAFCLQKARSAHISFCAGCSIMPVRGAFRCRDRKSTRLNS